MRVRSICLQQDALRCANIKLLDASEDCCPYGVPSDLKGFFHGGTKAVGKDVFGRRAESADAMSATLSACVAIVKYDPKSNEGCALTQLDEGLLEISDESQRVCELLELGEADALVQLLRESNMYFCFLQGTKLANQERLEGSFEVWRRLRVVHITQILSLLLHKVLLRLVFSSLRLALDTFGNLLHGGLLDTTKLSFRVPFVLVSMPADEHLRQLVFAIELHLSDNQ
mmetsp:Transcript_18150/g.31334  ORF Transcript_18150/g.31334 Transcript_18150/m.31334 type:complete len:228 (+) Transcript_18150:44-727(+)